MITPRKNLPMRFTAYTQCFRAEAGAAGRDTRGMIRNHQFSKVEMVSICDEDSSEDELVRMTIAENILQSLELPYRVVLLALKILVFQQKHMTWKYGYQDKMMVKVVTEKFLLSNCGPFQGRRMKAGIKTKIIITNLFIH